MTKSKYIAIFIILILLGSGVYAFLNRPKYTGPVENITVGVVPQFSYLVLLAQEKGYFTENGLNVVTKNYKTGPPIVKDMLDNKLDAGVTAEFVFVRNSFNSQDIKILSNISTSHVLRFVARSDHGIKTPADLKGKKVGITKGAATEFFLDRFLVFNGMTQKDVVIANLAPAEIVDKMLDGTIDAGMPFSNDAYTIENSLGEKIVTWDGQKSQDSYTLLLANEKFVTSHKDAVERFIKALLQAQDYAKANQKEAIAFFAKITSLNDQDALKFYPQFRPEISLFQSLLLALENQAQWMIDNKLTDKTAMPHFQDYIYTDALKKIKLDAVTVF